MKKILLAIFASLGFTEKVKTNTMTKEDYDKVSAEMQKLHGVTLLQALKKSKEEDADKLDAEHQEILSALFANSDGGDDGDGDDGTDGDDDGDGDDGADGGTQAQGGDAAKVIVAQIAKMQAKAIEQDAKIKALGENAENADGKVVGKALPKVILIGGPGTNKTHLFGIAHDMFALTNRWNIAAANGQAGVRDYTKIEKEAFLAAFNTYGTELGDRYERLQANGQLIPLVKGAIDYTDLETDLGAYYRVRRQDAIISHIIKLPSIAKVLPVRYNVQDEEVITNHFAGSSFSSAYQPGHVFAGSHKFQSAKAKVKDVMFKYKFDDLKKLEKEFIGYLNREGSDPMKWNFIEWLMVRTSEVLHNEKEMRRVRGVRVEPTTDKASYFLYGSDGILTTMDALAYAEKPSIYTLNSYKAYTRTTMVDYIWEFVREIYRMRGTLNGMALCINDLDVYDYLEGTRTKYGKDTDFAGEQLEIKNFIYNSIIRIPNMDMGRKDVFMMPKDALEIQENRAGEAYAFYFQRDLEQLIVASWFKEGTFAFAGKKFASKALMDASRGKQTRIFKNHPVSELAANATTADAFVNEMFETTTNTGATALTDITNAVEGVAYRVFCGSLTNKTTVAKSGKFDGITASYTPIALGDYLRVIYNPTTNLLLPYRSC